MIIIPSPLFLCRVHAKRFHATMGLNVFRFMKVICTVVTEHLRIDRLHVTSLPPCWRTLTKDSSLASIVSSTNMAAKSLPFDSQGIDCKSSILELAARIQSVREIVFLRTWRLVSLHLLHYTISISISISCIFDFFFLKAETVEHTGEKLNTDQTCLCIWLFTDKNFIQMFGFFSLQQIK